MGWHAQSCPKFIAMSMDERVTVCMQAKICMGCLNHNNPYTKDHKLKCQGVKNKQGKKSASACPAKPSCFYSIYTCVKHKDDAANVSILKMLSLIHI